MRIQASGSQVVPKSRRTPIFEGPETTARRSSALLAFLTLNSSQFTSYSPPRGYLDVRVFDVALRVSLKRRGLRGEGPPRVEQRGYSASSFIKVVQRWPRDGHLSPPFTLVSRTLHCALSSTEFATAGGDEEKSIVATTTHGRTTSRR